MPIYHMSPPWEVPQAPLPALETSVSWEALTGVTNINLSLSGIETDLQRSAENQRFWDGPYGLVQWLCPSQPIRQSMTKLQTRHSFGILPMVAQP